MKAANKANLGMSFETLIEAANHFYFDRGLAAIMKVPTAFKIQRRYNAKLKKSEIVGCFPEKKSTVDFLGQYYNEPVAFEAKSTGNKTSFPIKNIADHQLRWLKAVDQLGGKAFFLIECKTIGRIYRMTFKQLQSFQAAHERKSIPFDFFEKNCFYVSFNRSGVIDYLKDL